MRRLVLLLIALEAAATPEALDVMQSVADQSPSPRERADAAVAIRRMRARHEAGR